MKTILFLAMCFIGCWGYEEVDNQMTGQVKKVHHVTPLICPNYDTVDVSLGVIKNGIGSMSTHDLTMTVMNAADLEVLNKAALNASIVDIKYSKWRIAPCRENEVVQYAKLVE